MNLYCEDGIRFSGEISMLKYVWKIVLGKDLKIPFERLTYKDAMNKYMSDKPDLRKEEEYKF